MSDLKMMSLLYSAVQADWAFYKSLYKILLISWQSGTWWTRESGSAATHSRVHHHQSSQPSVKSIRLLLQSKRTSFTTKQHNYMCYEWSWEAIKHLKQCGSTSLSANPAPPDHTSHMLIISSSPVINTNCMCHHNNKNWIIFSWREKYLTNRRCL